jgi:hypothetical protein
MVLAAAADFLRNFRENVDAVCAFDARRCHESDKDRFARAFLRRPVGDCLQLRPEALVS